MYQYIKGLSVTLCLLSDKVSDKMISENLKRHCLDLLKDSNVFLKQAIKSEQLLEQRLKLVSIISFLDLIRIAGYASNMNVTVITNSILSFLKVLDKKINHSQSFSYSLLSLKNLDQDFLRNTAKNSILKNRDNQNIFSENFTNIPDFISTQKVDPDEINFSENSDQTEVEISKNEPTLKVNKNQNSESDVKPVLSVKVPAETAHSNGALVYTMFGDNEQKHIEERRTKILSILKLGGGNIRDLSKSFPGLNEKTLQRDLTELMRERKVIMLGKKRWAKYYLK